ncbi:MAG: serine/threonine-protein kinase, partial [Planctomycetota bacterium]|nr:serine/threonine-protein kinase [Planctomycetota bacterium]
MTSHVLCAHCQKKVRVLDIDPEDETCPHCEKIVTLSGNGTLSGSGTLTAQGTLSGSVTIEPENLQAASAVTELLWDRRPSKSKNDRLSSVPDAQSSSKKVRQTEARKLCREILNENPMFAPHIDTVLIRGEKLGEGGMGAVYRVKDRRLGREAALKILSDADPDSAMIQRFMREAKITARLDHPRVPPIYDAGMGEEGHFLLMRLIAGQTMKQLILELHSKEGPLRRSDFRPLLEALHKVSETVAYAHNRDILHRDLKPENIMIGAFGEVMVMDWGLARDLSEDSGHDSLFRSQVAKLSSDEYGTDKAVTQAGSIIGTPGYMSPEQAEGSEVNELTDVFALGAILTDILTGQAPIEGKTLLKKVMNTLNGVWTLPSDRVKTTPKELNDLARAALTLAPTERIPCADDFAQELHAYLTGEELKVHHYGPIERSQRWIRKNPGYVLALSLATLFIAAGAIFTVQLQRSENARLDALRISAENRKQLLEEETARWSAEQRAKRKSWQAAQAELQASEARKVIKYFTKARDSARRRAPVEEISKLVNAALDASQHSFPALLTAAEIYRDGQLIPQAKKILTQASETFSPAYEALFLLHNIELQEKKSRKAFQSTPALAKLIKRAAERNEVNQFVHFARGSKLADAKKYKEAIEAYTLVEQFSTGMPELYLFRGNAKLELGQLRAAIEDYSKAINLNPQLSLPWNNRGFAYVLLEQPKTSLPDFNKAIALDGSSSNYYFNRGLSYSALNNHEAALDNFQRALELDKTETVIHANIGLQYTKLFRYKEALAILNAGLKITPKFSRLFQLRASIYFLQNKSEDAIKDLTLALETTDHLVQVLVHRGRAWCDLKEWDKAFADFDRALAENPKDPVIYSNRGAAWTKKG